MLELRIDIPQTPEADIRARMNFDQVLGQVPATSTPKWKYVAVGTAIAVAIAIAAWLLLSNANKTTSDPQRTGKQESSTSLLKPEIIRVSTNGDRVIMPNGTFIRIPAGAIANCDGSDIPDSVELNVTHYNDPGDLFLGKINMQLNEKEILNSAGMLQVQAYDNGKELCLKKPIAISLPVREVSSDYRLYSYDNSKWTELEQKPVAKLRFRIRGDAQDIQPLKGIVWETADLSEQYFRWTKKAISVNLLKDMDCTFQLRDVDTTAGQTIISCLNIDSKELRKRLSRHQRIIRNEAKKAERLEALKSSPAYLRGALYYSFRLDNFGTVNCDRPIARIPGTRKASFYDTKGKKVRVNRYTLIDQQYNLTMDFSASDKINYNQKTKGTIWTMLDNGKLGVVRPGSWSGAQVDMHGNVQFRIDVSERKLTDMVEMRQFLGIYPFNPRRYSQEPPFEPREILDYRSLVDKSYWLRVERESTEEAVGRMDAIWMEEEVPKCVNLNEIERKIQYPPELYTQGVEGKVFFKILAGKNGRPKKHILLKSDNPLFTQACEKYVSDLRFTIAGYDNVPEEYWHVVPFNFTIDSQQE